MKKLLCAVLAIAMMLTACLAMAETVEEVIAQAQTMTNEELYAKAIEESNGKTLYGIGNSSRGKTAGASFIEMLQKVEPELHRMNRVVAAEEQLHLYHTELPTLRAPTTSIP